MGVMGSAWRGHLGGEGSSLVPDRVQGQHVPSWWNLWKDGSEGVMTEALGLGQALRGPGQPCRSGFSMFLHVARPGGRWKQTVGRPERLTQQVQVGLGCAVLASSGEGPGDRLGGPTLAPCAGGQGRWLASLPTCQARESLWDVPVLAGL